MKIGILSDTHLQEGQFLPKIVWDSFDGVDLILHAGDSVVAKVIEDLNHLAPVVAVKGNCDNWELNKLPEKEIISWSGLRIGLTHGNLGSKRNTVDNAFQAFKQESVDVIVFGHSHVPYLEWRNGILLFNPGSPTSKRREPKYSVGNLELIHGELQAKHLYF